MPVHEYQVRNEGWPAISLDIESVDSATVLCADPATLTIAYKMTARSSAPLTEHNHQVSVETPHGVWRDAPQQI